ncbi:hypothetical protein KTAU_29010 [Thermogemmatispora aurantia]|nr:hypothetical protein KTAU_29010 [Thermogemmatispora aurantia]
MVTDTLLLRSLSLAWLALLRSSFLALSLNPFRLCEILYSVFSVRGWRLPALAALSGHLSLAWV